jgi:hypothetical protein
MCSVAAHVEPVGSHPPFAGMRAGGAQINRVQYKVVSRQDICNLRLPSIYGAQRALFSPVAAAVDLERAPSGHGNSEQHQ